jgi:hypothetical protein
MAHFEHGALNLEGHLVDPNSALRRTPYTCPDCHRGVRVRKGNERAPHFAHNPDPSRSCTYYDRGATSTQKHRNAQFKLKQFLERLKEVDIGRVCPCGCGRMSHWGVRRFSDTVVKCEYRFRFNDSNKSADVAVLDSKGELVCIFEIVNTHYTREMDRPEPWHEIRADEINAIPSDAKSIALTCIREVLRPECIARQEAIRHARDERQRREAAAQREREAAQEEANRRWREERDRRFREETERWERRMAREREEDERLRANEQRHQETVVARRIDGERPHLTAVEQQRTQRHQQQMGVEEDQLRWDAVHPRHSELYKEYARDVTACMLCSTGFRWEESASLGRCQICSASIRKRVEQRLSPSHAHTLSE